MCGISTSTTSAALWFSIRARMHRRSFSAVQRTVKMCIRDRRIVSFGDNINDVPMFRISAESCAVANAVPEARAAAAAVV